MSVKLPNIFKNGDKKLTHIPNLNMPRLSNISLPKIKITPNSSPKHHKKKNLKKTSLNFKTPDKTLKKKVPQTLPPKLHKITENVFLTSLDLISGRHSERECNRTIKEGVRQITGVGDVSVSKIKFTSLKNPPFVLKHEALSKYCFTRLRMNRAGKIAIRPHFNSKVNKKVVKILFWYIFCGLFYSDTVGSFHSRGYVTKLRKNYSKLFVSIPHSQRDLFFDYYPFLLSYSIYIAMRKYFPDCEHAFRVAMGIKEKNMFFLKLHQIVHEMTTGIPPRMSLSKKLLKKLVKKNISKKNFYDVDQVTRKEKNERNEKRIGKVFNGVEKLDRILESPEEILQKRGILNVGESDSFKTETMKSNYGNIIKGDTEKEILKPLDLRKMRRRRGKKEFLPYNKHLKKSLKMLFKCSQNKGVFSTTSTSPLFRIQKPDIFNRNFRVFGEIPFCGGYMNKKKRGCKRMLRDAIRV